MAHTPGQLTPDEVASCDADIAVFEKWMCDCNLGHLLEKRGSVPSGTRYYLKAGTHHRWVGWRAALKHSQGRAPQPVTPVVPATPVATIRKANHTAESRQERLEAGLTIRALSDALRFIANHGNDYPVAGLVNIARDATNVGSGAAARRAKAAILTELAAALDLESGTEMTSAEFAAMLRMMAENELSNQNEN